MVGSGHCMFGSQVAERHTRSNGDARCWIDAAHDGVHVVAAGVQAVNRLALCIQHACVTIGDQACGCPNVTGVEGNGVERTFA